MKDELKTAVATRAATGIQPGQDSLKRVTDLIAENMHVFKQVIPATVTAERLTRIALTTIKQNKKLMECTVSSLLGAIMQCARFGFEPNTTGECYIIPYKNRQGVMEAQFQLGYVGHIQLVHRSGMASSIGVTEVCENDTTVLAYGPRAVPSVVKATGERGETIGYFSWIELRTGGFIWKYLTKAEAKKHRDKYSKSYKSSQNRSKETWETEFDEMASKTVLLKVMKLAPKSTEINQALFADGRVTRDYLELDNAESTVLPEEFMIGEHAQESDEPQDAEIVDPETPGSLFDEQAAKVQS